MKKQLSRIGLDTKMSEKLAGQLNKLLANYQMFYINARGYHWNIKGDKFFELHVKFEELYNNLQLKVDEVAERILTLGYTPMHSYSAYLKKADIKETLDITDGKKAVKHILDAYATIMPLQREILNTSAEANDEGTNALMSDYIREEEKLVWMYSAYLS
jgi:starvation-inducible DNA-binding protein